MSDQLSSSSRPPARPTRQRAAALLKIAAAGITVFGVWLCHRMATLDAGTASRAAVFVTLLTVAGGTALFAHGLGGRAGVGLGAVVGISTAIALAAAAATPPANELAFAAVATIVTAALGLLAGRGGWEPVRADRRGEAAAESDAPRKLCGAIAADFCEWTRGFVDPEHPDADRALPDADAGTAGPTWSDFDQFVRQTLRQHLNASGVRVFNVSADGETLHPLSCRRSAARRRESAGNAPLPGDATRPRELNLSARAGLVGHVLASGAAFVAVEPHTDGVCEELARDLSRQTDTAARPQQPQLRGWAWLLPLRQHGQARAVVAVARFADPSTPPPRDSAMARAVRDLLETHWAYVSELQGLHAVARTDRQSGMLNRTDLLMHLRHDAAESGRDGEPLMVLAIALEGLRGLDDGGAWDVRDALIERFAAVLHSRVRSDDALGRFSDDRFVVVLRRLDHALGRRIAQKLIDTARAAVEAAAAGGAALAAGARIAVRAGLAGTAGEPVSGDALLERALSLLDAARRQKIELATETRGSASATAARAQPLTVTAAEDAQ